MSAVQGVQGAQAASYATAAKALASTAKAPAVKSEVGETALQEHQEAISGKTEIGEGAGSKFSATA